MQKRRKYNEYVGKVRLNLPAQKAVQNANINKALAPIGLKARKVCEVFNKMSKKIPMNREVRVIVNIINAKQDKFDIVIHEYTTKGLVLETLGVEKITKDLSINMNKIEEIAKKMKQKVSTIIGTILSYQIKIND